MKILLCCVNYNSFDRLEKYLFSINQSLTEVGTAIDLTVLVADNSGKEEEITVPEGLRVKHYFTRKNLGYINAVDYAILQTGTDLLQYDYTIVSNVDILMDKSFFRFLERWVPEPDVAWLAPSIITLGTNRDRNPKILKRPGLQHMRRLQWMYKHPVLFWTNKLRNRLKRYSASSAESYIYAGHGSFMLFTQPFISRIRTFKFPSFLYGEEIFFGELVRRENMRVKYVPELIIADEAHASTGSVSLKVICKWNYESLSVLIDQFFIAQSYE